METEDYLLIGLLAVGAYFIWKESSRWSDATGARAMTSAGFEQGYSSMNQNATTFSAGNDTFLFRAGDFSRLNAAQRILITLDKAIPGTWLTRMVLK